MFEFEPRIEMMETIARMRYPGTVYGAEVDPVDAAAYVAVWQKLDEGNRATLEALALDDAIEIAWKVLDAVEDRRRAEEETRSPPGIPTL